MCLFGNESKILEEVNIEQSEVLIGYRCWYIFNTFNKEEKFLKSESRDYLWPKGKIILGNNLRDNSEGIYSYNYYNNYDNNYNNYNNYYYYNNYNNNYYYYNNNYKVVGKCLNFGRIFKYKEGYRAEKALPLALTIISKVNDKYINFINHFNGIITQVAKEYNIKTITQEEFEKQ